MQKNWPPRKWNEEARVRAEQRAYAKAVSRGEAIEKPSIAWGGGMVSTSVSTELFFINSGGALRLYESPKVTMSPEEMMEDAIDAAVRAARGAV